MLQKAAFGAAILFALVSAPVAAAERPGAQEALLKWYGLVLELVRHTPTYSPPVASRAFAYLGIAAYEATASGSPDAAIACRAAARPHTAAAARCRQGL